MKMNRITQHVPTKTRHGNIQFFAEAILVTILVALAAFQTPTANSAEPHAQLNHPTIRNEELVHRALSPEDLIGSWRLVSWTSTADGQTNFPFGESARGLLLYTMTGQMSVFLSQPNRNAFARSTANAGTAEEKVAAFDLGKG